MTRGIERVASVEANATVVQRDWLESAASSVKGAAAFAPAAFLTGIFVAPLAALATPVGMTAVAIGAGICAFGGATTNKTLMQVAFDDGTGIVAITAEDVPGLIENDARVIRDLARRQAAALKDVTPVGRRLADMVLPGRRVEPRIDILPPPAPVAALPAPTPTLLDTAGAALGATGAAAYDTAAAAYDTVGTAAGAVADTAGSLFSSALSFVRPSGKPSA